MQSAVFALLSGAGIPVRVSERSYRPQIALPDWSVKLLKPQNIIEMLHHGSRDVGFAGADWVAEFDHDLVELLDTGLDPVKLVVAAPTSFLVEGRLPNRKITLASEYPLLSARWATQNGVDATIVRTYGATEVFPPEDADAIMDNTSTGSTLSANGLAIVDTVLESSTRLYASRRALDDTRIRDRIDDLVLMLRSVLEARSRVMIEVNIEKEQLSALVGILPSMRKPTIASLLGESGYAVKVAVPRDRLAELIPQIRACGGTDIVVVSPSQILP